MNIISIFIEYPYIWIPKFLFMKNVTLFFALLLSCSAAFAQDGFYVKAGFGVGSSSSSFKVLPSAGNAYHSNVPSEQGQINVGHSFGNFQLETGLGYLATGVSFVHGGAGGGGCVLGPSPLMPITPQPNPVTYTILNPHITVPLMASYTLNKAKKLSVSPGIGVEALYNFNGKISAPKTEDPVVVMYYKYNKLGAAAVVKLDIQYNICSHLSVWCSPSYQNMVTSLTTKVAGDYMSRIYDRAFIFSAGLKYKLHGCCCHKPGTVPTTKS